MGKTNFLLLSIAILAFIFILGCTNRVAPEDQFYKTGESKYNLSAYINPYSNTSRELPGDNPCTCMFCSNYSMSFMQKFWNRFKGLVSSGELETTLAYGNCSFVPCNGTTFQSVIEDGTPDIYPRFFMIGQGPTPSEFSLAQRFCNGSLNMPVVWVSGNATKPGKPPTREAAGCFLARNQMPVVVFYNNDPSDQSEFMPLSVWIDTADSYNKAGSKNDPIGPVIMTTEALFNSSDGATLQRVKDEIDVISTHCPKCLVALAIGDMDQYAANYFLNKSYLPGAADQYYDKIDLVGMGFIANDNAGEKTCSPAASLGLRQMFSYKVLEQFHKPSVWYAVGVAEGKTSMRGCTFTPLDVRNAWEWVAVNIPGLAHSGIIGIAPYRYLDVNSTLPLQCDPRKYSCNFGFKNESGGQKNQSFFGWFTACQLYFTDTTWAGYAPKVNASQQPVAFSQNGKGIVCSFADITKMGILSATRVGYADETPVIPEPSGELTSRIGALSCGSCIAEAPMPKSFCFWPSPGFPSSSCKKLSEFGVDDAVLSQNFDPIFMRALFQKETGFDNCAISEAPMPAPGKNNPCGQQKECTVLDFYARATDPVVGTQYCPSGAVYDRCINIKKDITKQVCAIGLAQCIENVHQDPTPGKICGGAAYNPFNPRDASCCGTFKFSTAHAKYLAQLNAELAVNPQLRKLVHSGEEGWYAAWLATRDYYGDGPSLANMTNYALRSDASADKMVQYIYSNYLASKGVTASQYGLDVITLYNDALDKCGGGCPVRDCSDKTSP